MATEYCVGFAFNNARDSVLLIEKQRPPWQKGQFNGIGGHVEDSESPEEAMAREFEEETGQRIEDWEHTIILYGTDWSVHFFLAFIDNGVMNSACGGPTDENVVRIDCDELPKNIIPNLRWLVPLHRGNETFDRGDRIAMAS